MNESMPPSLPPPSSPRMSLGARLMNIFIGPSEVFEEVEQGPPSTPNWLVPAVLLCLVGIVSVFVVLSQDTILQQMREQKERAIQKKLENVPKEQREQVMQAVEKWSDPALMKGLGAAATVPASFGWLFFLALVLWLMGVHLFKGSFTFMQTLEVCGLAGMVSVLGGIITMLLIVVMGNSLATPSPALLIHEPDPANLAHLVLSQLNVMTLWHIGVLAIGLAKLSGASVAKAAGWLYGLWAVFGLGLVCLGWFVQRLFS